MGCWATLRFCPTRLPVGNEKLRSRVGRAHAVRARHLDVSLWHWFHDLLSSPHHRTPKCRATIKLLPDLQGSSNTTRQETIWLGDTPVAVVKPDPVTQQPNIYFIEADHLNTPRVILNSAHTPIWRWDSDAFGQGQPDEDPDSDGQSFEYNLRFPGQYYDRETGLHYNYYRDYEPGVGRYIESDPIGLKGGTNTFAYANQNPLVYIDSLGLCPACGPNITCYACGQKIKCVAGQTPPPQGCLPMNGPLSPLPLSGLSCDAQCNTVVGIVCGAAATRGGIPAWLACKASVYGACKLSCDNNCKK